MSAPLRAHLMQKKLFGFLRFAWGVLAFNLPVIVWGAFVRASHSGDGCGSHWPLCDGQFIPKPKNIQTVIEFTHRVMSGIDGLLVLCLLIFALRLFPRGHHVRYAAVLSFVFTLVEALIGRALVKYGWVNRNDSVARGIVLAAHLPNTFLLLGSFALTAVWSL